MFYRKIINTFVTMLSKRQRNKIYRKMLRFKQAGYYKDKGLCNMLSYLVFIDESPVCRMCDLPELYRHKDDQTNFWLYNDQNRIEVLKAAIQETNPFFRRLFAMT